MEPLGRSRAVLAQVTENEKLPGRHSTLSFRQGTGFLRTNCPRSSWGLLCASQTKFWCKVKVGAACRSCGKDVQTQLLRRTKKTLERWKRSGEKQRSHPVFQNTAGAVHLLCVCPSQAPASPWGQRQDQCKVDRLALKLTDSHSFPHS